MHCNTLKRSTGQISTTVQEMIKQDNNRQGLYGPVCGRLDGGRGRERRGCGMVQCGGSGGGGREGREVRSRMIEKLGITAIFADTAIRPARQNKLLIRRRCAHLSEEYAMLKPKIAKVHQRRRRGTSKARIRIGTIVNCRTTATARGHSFDSS